MYVIARYVAHDVYYQVPRGGVQLIPQRRCRCRRYECIGTAPEPLRMMTGHVANSVQGLNASLLPGQR
jgi:hypothetical protein